MGPRISDWPLEERPRERLDRFGPSTLSGSELVALVLRTGTRGGNVVEEARDLLARCGGLRGLSQLGIRELARRPGVGPAKAASLVAALELGRRISSKLVSNGSCFRRSADVYHHFRSRMAPLRKEVFYAVLLDAKHRKLGEVEVSVGSLTASIVHPREVFAPAVRESAAAVILIHNHPSGDPTPSSEDVAVTRRLREAGDLMGVKVLDHVIVGAAGYFSFVDRGRW